MSRTWPYLPVDAVRAKSENAIAIGPFGSRMKSDLYVPDGIPVIRGNNISDTRELVGEFVFISPDTADQLRSSNVYAGDLLFPHRGAIGKVGIVPSGREERYVLSSSLMKLTCNPEIADPKFFFYFFRSPEGQHALLKHASTVGTPGIGQPLSSLRSITVPVPPVPEQSAIANILGTLDDKIELNRRMNETLEAMARALFKSWFIDFDPARAKAEGRDPGLPEEIVDLFPHSFEDSELGEIPKGWCVTSLKDLFGDNDDCVITGPFGSTLHAHDYREDGVPLILVKHVVDGQILEHDLPRVGEHKLRELNRYHLKLGDIVFTRVGAVGRSGYAHSRHVGWLISGQMLRVRIPDWNVFHPRYLSQLFREKAFTDMVEGHALGTTRPSLNTALLKTFRFIAPRADLVKVFAGKVTVFDALIQKNQAESRILASIRDTLLPKLLAGEIRIHSERWKEILHG